MAGEECAALASRCPAPAPHPEAGGKWLLVLGDAGDEEGIWIQTLRRGGTCRVIPTTPAPWALSPLSAPGCPRLCILWGRIPAVDRNGPGRSWVLRPGNRTALKKANSQILLPLGIEPWAWFLGLLRGGPGRQWGWQPAPTLELRPVPQLYKRRYHWARSWWPGERPGGSVEEDVDMG